jgi:dihydroorotase
MDYIFKNCKVYREGNFVSEDIGVCGGVFAPVVSVDGATVIDCKDKYILPGFADVHVHLREPGFIYKETVASGSLAAAAGGYTTVCSMPNLIPAPDSPATLAPQLEAIKNTACINVLPYGTITKEQKGEELADMEGLAPLVAAFSDDGKGVQSEEMMLAAMQKAKALDKIIAAHCEDNSLLNGGYIHDGEYAKAHGHRGICSESEWGPIKRDLELAAKTGCKYHVCHISTKESVELIRQAKKNGVDVTCETGPHYLILDDSDLREEGRFKMNPPLRSKADREALIEGIIDGTIDMIATDHAPHSAEEKGRGLEKSAFGIVGIETAFPLMYTYTVKQGVISLEKLIELLVYNPRERFGLPIGDGLSVWRLDEEFTADPAEFISKGKATPFEGYRLFGRCYGTLCNGKAYKF